MAPPGGNSSINIFGSGYDDGMSGRSAQNRQGVKGKNGEVGMSS